ncbi:MAG: phytanoyl-CoA dioxygenase family protein [Myxococcota bacterium]|nr:phytanoyl-CoA dioxygenase family protein [Myxococcota bacterium]
MFTTTLDAAADQRWAQDHRLHLPGALSAETAAALKQWVDELESWPEVPGRWMKYFESANESARVLCRMENFADYHEPLSELVRGSATLAIVSRLMGEPAVLYKEKINFKKPGGGGFTAHQDAPAFATFGHTYHITMMVAVDDATVDTGCMEFSTPVPVGTTLRTAADGTVHPELEAQMQWNSLEVKAGDIVFFDSFIPHRSKANLGMKSRRALFLTYNREADGDVRSQYFADKRRYFPPECEREEGVDYESTPSPYNLGNPIR